MRRNSAVLVPALVIAACGLACGAIAIHAPDKPPSAKQMKELWIDPAEDPGSAPRDRDWRLVAALVARDARTAIQRGENAGELLDEAAVVRALSERVPLPLSPRPARIQLSKPADLAWSGVDVVVFAQSEVTREIGAVRLIEARDLRQ